jgi:hypothetical protein
MKMNKKILHVALGLIVAVGLVTTTALAEVCENATVDRVMNWPDMAKNADGESSQYGVWFTCNDLPTLFSGSRKFWLVHELGDSGFATLLTAYSMGTPVQVYMEGKDWNSLVTRVSPYN